MEKKMTAIANETVKIGDVELPKHSDTLNFTVPPADKIKPSQAAQTVQDKDKEGNLLFDTSVNEAGEEVQVPKLRPLAGSKYEKTFYFPQVTTEDEANAVCTVKEWDIVSFVNDALKSAARASAYQAESALYKPSDVPDEDIVERMVRDFIRMGLSEEKARKRVAAALAED